MNTNTSELVITSQAVDFLNGKLVAPYFKASTSSLGGSKFWCSVVVSLDARETWNGGYIENSRYARLSLVVEGDKWAIECFSGSFKRDFAKKWRKTSVRTLEEVAEKINAWVKFNLDTPVAV